MTWAVRVNIGDVQVRAVQLDPRADPYVDQMPLPALLAVSWIDQLEADRWPAPQGPSTGNLVIRFPRAFDIEWVDSTTSVLIRFYRDAADVEPTATFRGRASTPEFTAHDKGVDARFALVDLLSDLSDTVGDEDWPQENARQRLNRMFAAAGLAAPSTAGYSDVPLLAARESDPQTLLALAQQTLGWSVWTLDGQPQLLELVAPDFDEWAVERVPTHADAVGILIYDDDRPSQVLVVPVEGIPAEAVISAGWIVAGSQWVRATPLPSTVHVLTASKARSTASQHITQPPPRLRVETQLVDNFDAGRLAAYLCPDAIVFELPQWEAHGFTVALDHTPDDYWVGDLRDVRVITGLQPRHNPIGEDWTAGVMLAREIRIERGRCEVDLTLGARPIRDGVTVP